MKELYIQLEVIRITAKQLHYSLSGESFFANHLLMDKITENLSDYEDEIVESCIMSLQKDKSIGNPPNLSEMFFEIASRTLKNPSKTDLERLLQHSIEHIEAVSAKDGFQGDFDLLGRISNNLRQSFSLLGRVVFVD